MNSSYVLEEMSVPGGKKLVLTIPMQSCDKEYIAWTWKEKKGKGIGNRKDVAFRVVIEKDGVEKWLPLDSKWYQVGQVEKKDMPKKGTINVIWDNEGSRKRRILYKVAPLPQMTTRWGAAPHVED